MHVLLLTFGAGLLINSRGIKSYPIVPGGVADSLATKGSTHGNEATLRAGVARYAINIIKTP